MTNIVAVPLVAPSRWVSAGIPASQMQHIQQMQIKQNYAVCYTVGNVSTVHQNDIF